MTHRARRHSGGAARRAPSLAALGALALLLVPAVVRASCCIFEDPLLAVGDVAARSGGVRLGLESEWLAARAGTQMAGAPMSEEVDQATLRAVAVYSPLERVNVVAVAPFVRKRWRARGGGMPEDAATVTGLGDVDLGVRVALWRSVEFVPDRERIAVTRAQALALSAGSSIPTGADGATSNGVPLEEHALIGTGAWGPYAGLVYRLQRAPWDLLASGTVRARTENARGYRYGAALLANVDVRREVLPDRLSVGLGVEARAAAADAERGTAVWSTGGAVVAAVPGLSLDLGWGFRLRARAPIPIWAALRGDQAARLGILVGVTWELRL